MAHAIGIIHEENGTFGISFPDFPGCISSGRTLDEAVSNGAQALAFHVEGMIEDGEAMPNLSTLEVLKATEADWLHGGVAVAVPVELPGKSVRINISVEERALERIDRAASAEGKTRSGFLVEAALLRARAAAAPAETSFIISTAEREAGARMMAAIAGTGPSAKPKRKA